MLPYNYLSVNAYLAFSWRWRSPTSCGSLSSPYRVSVKGASASFFAFSLRYASCGIFLDCAGSTSCIVDTSLRQRADVVYSSLDRSEYDVQFRYRPGRRSRHGCARSIGPCCFYYSSARLLMERQREAAMFSAMLASTALRPERV